MEMGKKMNVKCECVKKAYTPIRRFYSWVGFGVTVVAVSFVMATIIHFCIGFIISINQ